MYADKYVRYSFKRPQLVVAFKSASWLIRFFLFFRPLKKNVSYMMGGLYRKRVYREYKSFLGKFYIYEREDSVCIEHFNCRHQVPGVN
jgi:hypothetical protein